MHESRSLATGPAQILQELGASVDGHVCGDSTDLRGRHLSNGSTGEIANGYGKGAGKHKDSPIHLSSIPGSRKLETEEKFQFDSTDHGASRNKHPAR